MPSSCSSNPGHETAKDPNPNVLENEKNVLGETNSHVLGYAEDTASESPYGLISLWGFLVPMNWRT